MIHITRSSANTCVLTLTEKVTLTSPYFLFEFKCSQNGQLKYFIAANTSSYTYRFDQFTITEVASGAESLTTGSVNLAYVGEWQYRVWEQASSSNLSPLSTEPLETGLVRVHENPSTITKYSGNTNSYTQYNYPL